MENFDSHWITKNRPARNEVDKFEPYACLVEKERSNSGLVEDTGIIFLTNKECSFTCLMCDLWKNTTLTSVPTGAIPEQIRRGLKHMPDVSRIKLYNSGSFFDVKSIPEEDYESIAALVQHVDRVIVEGHPKLIGQNCLDFRDMLQPELEVAIGLETVEPNVLKKLNKKMEVQDFVRAVKYLKAHHIDSRAFILVRPPFMSEKEGVFWAKKSIDLAFEAGVSSCTVIPVRAGNGAMDLLEQQGQFEKPSLDSLEEVLEYGISLGAGHVFADTWDLRLFSKCEHCLDARTRRIVDMNLHQKLLKKVNCKC